MNTRRVVSSLVILLLSLFSGYHGVDGGSFKPTKLFVFGDSYADTGNSRKAVVGSWAYPYGITFPGKPAGRYSDGRVSTDLIAKFLELRSPIPYRLRKYAPQLWKYGMNFAFGGTGVFDTLSLDPNMTVQIDFFQKLIRDKVYSATDLKSSVALVSVAGNDYNAYLARNGTLEGLKTFVTKVVSQLVLDLKRIHSLGVRRIAVPALPPLGCFPPFAAPSSYQKCNATLNQLVGFHNSLLRQDVAKLNNESNEAAFVILDFYNGFLTVFNNTGQRPGSVKFANPLKPCCMGTSSEYVCGSVDSSGAKKYSLCDDRKLSFFWDTLHPTQEGWRTVYSFLQPDLEHILE